MARIPKAQYETMPSYAKQMRSAGQELNQALIEAYTNIANMHSVWYGKRYNSLLQQFNNMIPQMSELLEFVVAQLPFALETIANNYAQADRGQNVTSAEETVPNFIEELPIMNDVGMRFITNDVANTQRIISEKFEASKDLMNKIEAEYAKVQWQSEASDSFKSRFAQLKSEIMASFDNINTQFINLMNQTQQDIETTEKANTVQ